jgi:hypothetical protein
MPKIESDASKSLFTPYSLRVQKIEETLLDHPRADFTYQSLFYRCRIPKTKLR